MTPSPSTTRKPLLESPWYWVYLFATGALIALLLLGWKFGPRQAQIENKFLGHEAAERLAAERRAAGEPAASGDTGARELSTADDTMIDLTPLYLILAVVFIVAWIAVWRHLFLRPQETSTADSTGDSINRVKQVDDGAAKLSSS